MMEVVPPAMAAAQPAAAFLPLLRQLTQASTIAAAAVRALEPVVRRVQLELEGAQGERETAECEQASERARAEEIYREETGVEVSPLREGKSQVEPLQRVRPVDPALLQLRLEKELRRELWGLLLRRG